MTRRAHPSLLFLLPGCTAVCGSPREAPIVHATPANYLELAPTLRPGDTLVLEPGDYTQGLGIEGLQGEADRPVTIRGPDEGPMPRFVGARGEATIHITDSSHITFRRLLLDGMGARVTAIKASGGVMNWSHNIIIEDCIIRDYDGGGTAQQGVGISTKIVSWDWIIRRNLIERAGTGIYLGNSNGENAFFGGLIEGNLIRDPLGYDLQIKFQKTRGSTLLPRVPRAPRVTVIRDNVFTKSDRPSPEGARPNVLVDGFPEEGPGSTDRYEIYGNFFRHNRGEPLLQASGRVLIHDNIFVDSSSAAIKLKDHDGKTVLEATIHHNTMFATASGVELQTITRPKTFVAANAIFATQALAGGALENKENIAGSIDDAARFFNRPGIVPGEMDFYPRQGGGLCERPLDQETAAQITSDRDFNGAPRAALCRGAYEGEGENPGWRLNDEFKK